MLEGVGGCCFGDCNEAPVVSTDGEPMAGVAAYALDPKNADRLWEVSLQQLQTWGIWFPFSRAPGTKNS